MIEIKDLKESDRGRWITYTDPHEGEIERGKIKSWNEVNVFVVYKCNQDWDKFMDYTGQATDPRDLDFEF